MENRNGKNKQCIRRVSRHHIMWQYCMMHTHTHTSTKVQSVDIYTLFRFELHFLWDNDAYAAGYLVAHFSPHVSTSLSLTHFTPFSRNAQFNSVLSIIAILVNVFDFMVYWPLIYFILEYTLTCSNNLCKCSFFQKCVALFGGFLLSCSLPRLLY